MFCPKCGKKNPDNNEVCSGCNAPLHTEEENKNTPKKKNWIGVAITVVAVAVVVTVAIILLTGCGGGTAIPEEGMTF